MEKFEPNPYRKGLADDLRDLRGKENGKEKAELFLGITRETERYNTAKGGHKIEFTDSKNEEVKDEKEIQKYFKDYFLKEDDDWTKVLLNKRDDEYNFQSISEERKKDNQSIENYQNGQQIKLVIFNTYFKIVNRFIINKKLEDGTYNGPQAANGWHIPNGTLYGYFTKELLLKHVNLRYDLLEEVLKSKIKPLLVDSTFLNSKNEFIKIKNIDFSSGEMEFEYNQGIVNSNYYEVIRTSSPLQEHIASIIKFAKTKE